MKHALLAAAFAALGLAGQANAGVINFDSQAFGSTATIGTFDALGVRFNQNLHISNGGSGDLPQSAPNAAINADSFGGDITGYFLGPVSSVNFISVFAGDQGGDSDTVTLRGFDALNNLVASASFTGLVAQTLSISGAGMTRFEILQTGLIGIDDFTFTEERGPAAAVPEPGSLALLGLGLAGALVARRRKQA
ncbi:PEP-CTERM sorting domain-containing protein [Pseudoduganella sp.]|uniref:PEP-CTERM sorting domain-containing protein n=1 Tax=Pseudoduganella sp. TaxID=1880898 RepID=UPI0035AE366F